MRLLSNTVVVLTHTFNFLLHQVNKPFNPPGVFQPPPIHYTKTSPTHKHTHTPTRNPQPFHPPHR